MNLSAKCERRMLDLAELRLESDGEARTIRGYAAVFDSLSSPLMGFREVIRKGAFKKTIKDGDIRALWNHDPNYVLGRKSARTLRLDEDEKGLHSRIFPPDTQWARDLMHSIERGDVSQMSFGFRVVKDNWLPAGQDGLPVRELLSVQLFDVSPVTFPAYPQTEVHVRALMDAVLWKMEQGPLAKEERQAMALALENLRINVLEPGQPHSGEAQQAEPGQPHSDERRQDPPQGVGQQETARAQIEERQRALRALRQRMMKYVTA